MKKLPKTVYIVLEDPGTDDAWLNTQSERNDLVEMNRTREIGEYVLQRRVEVRGEAQELREIG